MSGRKINVVELEENMRISYKLLEETFVCCVSEPVWRRPVQIIVGWPNYCQKNEAIAVTQIRLCCIVAPWSQDGEHNDNSILESAPSVLVVKEDNI